MYYGRKISDERAETNEQPLGQLQQAIVEVGVGGRGSLNCWKYYRYYITGAESGMHERRLLNDLLANYNKLERPVINESEAVQLSFGLTLQQIIDVVSILLCSNPGLMKNIVLRNFFS